MSLRERINMDTYVDDNGDVLPYADVIDQFDHPPVSNESIAQGMSNLEHVRRKADYDAQNAQEAEIDGEKMHKRREHAIAEAALRAAGPHELIGEHVQTQLALLDAVSDISMYRGGEKGGYKSTDFNERYGPVAPRVERGARKNHQKLVNKTFPELLKASQLIEAGFDEYDVADMVNATRIKLLREYGGPEKEKARTQLRTALKKR